jgi:aminoglycoside 3-N-acetyltransferase I
LHSLQEGCFYKWPGSGRFALKTNRGNKHLSISCKLLTRSHVSLFKKLLDVFGDAFEEPRTCQAAAPSNSYLEAVLGKDHFIAIAALDGNRVVGGLAAYVLDKFEQERREIYIYDLAVSKDYRRRGIATGLINKLKVIAGERNAYVIFVQADHGDVPAIRLYESLGKKEDVYHFDIPVKESRTKNIS